jgi:hypothetical protein
MVVLAVTWMAKAGREAEVASIFSKLSEESRKEPDVSGAQAPHGTSQIFYLRAV